MFKAIVLLFSCIVLAVVADRNFSVHHFAPGSNCEGKPFLIQDWSKPGPNDFSCATEIIPGGTTEQNTPKAFKAFCEKTTLSLLDSVIVLRLSFYYLRPQCEFGSPEDEKPLTATVGTSGTRCFKEGVLFPNSAVLVYHDCENSGGRLGYGLFSLALLAISCLQVLY